MTRSHRLLALVVVLWATTLQAQQILIPDQVAPYAPIVGRCDYVIPNNATAQLSWRIDDKATFIPVKDDKGLTDIHIWAPPGDHWAELTIITQFFREITVWVPDEKNPEDFTKARREVIKITDKYDIQRIEKDFKVLSPEPGPNPPGPNPPGPGPGPSPNPIGEGLRVMIVEETEDRPKLPWSQQVALQSGNLVELLNASCAKDEKGKPDWRRWDDDMTEEQIALMPERWRKPYKDAVAYMRTLGNSPSVPVIVVSNPKKNPPGELTKLPLTDDAVLELVKKYKDN